MIELTADSPCPCGGGRFADCCQPVVLGARSAATATALMRSRYTANVLAETAHLLRSAHPRTRPPRIETDSTTRWLGLKIKQSEGGGPGDDAGTVEFVARFKRGSRGYRLHERSRFVRMDDYWFYLGPV